MSEKKRKEKKRTHIICVYGRGFIKSKIHRKN